MPRILRIARASIFGGMDSLFAPPSHLPPDMEPYRFWIWLQLIVLRLYVRAVKGGQASFLYGIDDRGGIVLLHIGDRPGEVKPDPFAWEPSRTYREALAGSDPDCLPFRSPWRTPEPGAASPARAALDPGLYRDERASGPVPPPDP